MTNGDVSPHAAYIRVEAVANRLRRTVHQARRYAEEGRTIKKSRRIEERDEAVETLADELNGEERVPPRTEVMPVGEVMQTFERQQERIAQLERARGRREGVLHAQQRRLEDADKTR